MLSLLLTQLLLLGPLLSGIATHPPEAVEDIIAQVQGDGSDLRSLPKLQAARLSDVLGFQIESDMLTITPLLKPAESQVQLLIPNIRGGMKLMIFESPDPASKVKSFNFQRDDRHDPIYGESSASVSGVGSQIMLSRFFESGTMHGEIQFTQDAPTPDAIPGDQAPVRLLVSITHTLTDAKWVNLNLGANTFTQLCMEHRADIDRYLRPIVRDLHQDVALFAVPPALAWQVLGDPSANPALQTKVKQLLRSADAEDYRQRQAAIDSLKALGAEVQPILRKMDRSQLSAQQASIVESLCADAGGATTNATTPESDPSFLLDVLYSSDPRLKTLALQRLQKVTGQAISPPDVRDDLSIQHLRDRILPPLPVH